jgi:hypothetical protein
MKLLLRLRMLAFTSSLRLGHSEFLLVLERTQIGAHGHRGKETDKAYEASVCYPAYEEIC